MTAKLKEVRISDGKRVKVLAIDVGGTHVKLLASGAVQMREFPSGPGLTARQMVARTQKLTRDWKFDVVSLGYPGVVHGNRVAAEPHNLGGGWVGTDFRRAFGCPTRIINDAAMQAVGSYTGGKMLFLGLGTGLGSALVVDGIVEPMELGHLPYRNATYEKYVGERALKRMGKGRWRKYVADVVARLSAALQPDDIVLGGGNVKHLKKLPPGCRAGNNADAFLGGFALWGQHADQATRQRVMLAVEAKVDVENP